MTIEDEIKEIQGEIKKISDYFNSDSTLDDSEKEKGIFFTKQLMINLNGANTLLEAVLNGKKESLKHSKNYANAAKNTVPHITDKLEKINDENALVLKKEIEESFNECWSSFFREFEKIS